MPFSTNDARTGCSISLGLPSIQCSIRSLKSTLTGRVSYTLLLTYWCCTIRPAVGPGYVPETTNEFARKQCPGKLHVNMCRVSSFSKRHCAAKQNGKFSNFKCHQVFVARLGSRSPNLAVQTICSVDRSKGRQTKCVLSILIN